MKRLLILLPLLLLWSCTPPASLPNRPEQLHYQPLVFQLPQVEKSTLANGVHLYLQEDHELPLVSVTAVLSAGSIGDPQDKIGLASLYATLLRTGGTSRLTAADLDARLEFLAIDLSVSAETYAITIDMSLRSADLQEGLTILADLLRHPAFAADRLEIARQQAIESVRRAGDVPSSVARKLLGSAIYPDHRLGETATRETLERISRDDLLDFHQHYAVPENLWLAVTGDFATTGLEQQLQQLLGDWSGAAGSAQVIPPLKPEAPPAIWFERKAIPQTTVLFGELGVAKDNPDLPALRVMNYILGGGGFNSRVMREVRSNRGLAYSVYSYYQPGRWLPGMFVAGVETKNESVVEVVELMRKLMLGMSQQPVSDEELQLAKESLINSFVFAFDNSHDVVTQALRLDLYRYPANYLESYREKIAAVTTADVQRVARDYLHPQRQALVLVGDPPVMELAAELQLPLREQLRE